MLLQFWRVHFGRVHLILGNACHWRYTRTWMITFYFLFLLSTLFFLLSFLRHSRGAQTDLYDGKTSLTHSQTFKMFLCWQGFDHSQHCNRLIHPSQECKIEMTVGDLDFGTVRLLAEKVKRCKNHMTRFQLILPVQSQKPPISVLEW